MSQNKIIAKEDFLNSYFNHYQKCLKNNKFKYIKMPNIKSNSFSTNRFQFMNEFINENVSDKIYKEKLDKEKKEKIHKLTKNIKAKIEEKELNNFIIRKKMNESKIKNLITDDGDTDLSFEKQKEKKEEQRLIAIHKELEEWKKRKKYKLKSKEPEMNLILGRLDDLRELELNYAKNNSNFILDSMFFNEYYFKLKKQLSNAQRSAKNLNKTGQIFYKKINTPNKYKNNIKYNERNNSALSYKINPNKYHDNSNTSRIFIKKRYKKENF